MNNVFDQYEVWFVTGAQLLYGGDAVIAVDAHSNEMVNGLNESGKLPVKVVYKGTANSSKEVETVFKAANNDEKCIGVITWMHTFSPAKMWIHGLQQLKKPLLHLHTQFNKEIPWDTMDMDFMNLNQSAHGDREFGHICTRMRIRRKVVVGHWKEEDTLHKIAVWMRVCAGWADSQDMLIIRFGDQMNNVAVTDGDKVEAEQRMGYHVDYCPVSELMEYHKEIKLSITSLSRMAKKAKRLLLSEWWQLSPRCKNVIPLRWLWSLATLPVPFHFLHYAKSSTSRLLVSCRRLNLLHV